LDFLKKIRTIFSHCLTNLAVGNHGTSEVRFWMSSMPDESHITGGNPIGFPYITSAEILRAGGDSQSAQCLRFYKFANGTDFADVVVIFWYSLQTQPDFGERNDVRFVAYKGTNGNFEWFTQPVEHAGNYCESYYKPNQP